jgi:PKD repeat protein
MIGQARRPHKGWEQGSTTPLLLTILTLLCFLSGCSKNNVVKLDLILMPSTAQVLQGDAITLSGSVAVSNWMGAVTLVLENPPAGISLLAPTVTITDQNPVTVEIKLKTTEATPAGSSSLRLVLQAGSLSASANFSLLVKAQPKLEQLAANPAGLPSNGGAAAITWAGQAVKNYLLAVSPSLGVIGIPTGPLDQAVTSTNLTFPANISSNSKNYTITLTAKGEVGSTDAVKTTTVTVAAAPAPTFTIALSPKSGNVIRPATVSSTLTITPQNGLTGMVSLALENPPAGVSITPSSVNVVAGAVMQAVTIETSALTPLGLHALTMKASQGGISQSASYSLTVGQQPVITSLIANPNNLASNGGTTALTWLGQAVKSYLLEVSPSLGVTGIPAGPLDQAFTSANLSFPANTSTNSAKNYTITLTAKGESGSTDAIKTTTVTVDAALQPSFGLLLSPNSATVIRPASANTTLTVTPQNGLTGMVSLSLDNPPAGVSIMPSSVNIIAGAVTQAVSIQTSALTPLGLQTLTLKATQGNISKTASYNLTVAEQPILANLAANPNALASGGGVSAITWAGQGVKNYLLEVNPSLGVTGVPVSLLDQSTTSANLTFPANPSTTSSQSYTITLTAKGESGSSDSIKTVIVTVNATQVPNFGITLNPKSGTVIRPASSSTTLSVTPQNGMTGMVSLVLENPPAGVSIMPSSVNIVAGIVMQPLTIETTALTPVGLHTLTIKASQGNISQSASYALTVNEQPVINSLIANPNNLPSNGGSAVITWLGQGVKQYVLEVNPSQGVTGVPVGAIDAATTMLNLTFPTNLSTSNPKNYSLTLTAKGESGTTDSVKTVMVTLDAAQVPNFTIDLTPSSGTVIRPASASTTLAVTPQNGLTGMVSLSLDNPPIGVSLTPSSVNIIAGAVMQAVTIQTTALTPVGLQMLTLKATQGNISKTASYALTVNQQPAISSFVANPNSLPSNGGASTITWAGQGAKNYLLAVSPSLGVTGVPVGLIDAATTMFNLSFPANENSNSPQSYTLTLTAKGENGTTDAVKTATVTLAAAPLANFTIDLSPNSSTVIRPASASGTLTVTPQNGLTGMVSLSLDNPPAGVSITPSSVNIVAGAVMQAITIQTTALTPIGLQTLTLKATQGSISKSASYALTVNQQPAIGSFVANPNGLPSNGGTSAMTWAGQGVKNYLLAVSPSLGVTGVPVGAIDAATTMLNLGFPANLSTSSPQSYTITLTAKGENGTTDAVKTATVTVAAAPMPDLSLALNPSSGMVIRPASASGTLTVTPQNGLVGMVSLSIDNPPAGITITPSSVNIVAGAVMQAISIQTTALTPAGLHNLTIRAMQGAISKTIGYALTVTATVNQQFGSSQAEAPQWTLLDASDNIIVVGYSEGDLDGAGPGPFGGRDVFVAKYSSGGVLQWMRQFGSASFDEARFAGLDSNGRVVIAGYSEGDIDAAGPGPFGSADGFVTQFDSNGNQSWIRQFGSSDYDETQAASLRSNGTIAIAGYSEGDIDGAGPGPFGDADAFVLQYDSNGNQSWSRQFGTIASDNAQAVAVNSNGEVFVAGSSNGSFAGASNAGGSDAFVAKYDSGGNQSWLRQFGSTLFDESSLLQANNSGGVVIGGSTLGNLDGAGPGPFGDADVFLAQYDGGGNQSWLRQIGSSDFDDVQVLTISASNKIVLLGYSFGDIDGAGAGPFGNLDGFVAQYSNNGSQDWLTQFGSNNADTPASVSVTNSGTISIAGTTFGDLDGNTPGGGPFGDADGFVLRYSNSGMLLASQQVGSALADGLNFALLDANGDTIVCGSTNGDLDGAGAGPFGSSDILLAKLKF